MFDIFYIKPQKHFIAFYVTNKNKNVYFLENSDGFRTLYTVSNKYVFKILRGC